MKVKELYDNPNEIDIKSYLIKCGVDENIIEKYIEPDESCFEKSDKYDNMEEAKRLIARVAALNIKTAYIIVDSDVDGLCSATIAYRTLKQCGIKNIKPIFHKAKTHGLCDSTYEQIGDDCCLLWIPDASENDKKFAKLIEDRNIPCIVTDHHDTIKLSDKIITINNKWSDVENKFLSGAGVTHKFCEYLVNGATHEVKDSIRNRRDLVALSIVSDSCNLQSLENRAYVHFGLNNINNSFFAALCQQIKGTITPTELSFNVINLLNAVCRSDNQEAKQMVFDCFCGNNTNYTKAINLCKSIKREQDNKVKQAMNDCDLTVSKNLVAAITSGVDAVSGLMANKFMSKYNRPAMVLHESGNALIGSVRSPVDIREELNKTAYFNFNSGHSKAFGTSVKTSKNLPKIIEFCNGLDLNDSEEYTVVGSYDWRKIPCNLFGYFNKFSEMFGEGVPAPTIHVKFKTNGKNIYEMGNGSTIKMLLGDVTAIKFFCGKEYRESIHVGEDVELEVDIIGKPSVNEYNGNRNNQIVIDKMVVCEDEKKEIFDELW